MTDDRSSRRGRRSRRSRRGRRPGRGVAGAVIAPLALVAAACVPPSTPSVPPPALPAGVGVTWLRDSGGTYDPVDGRYTPAWQAWQTFDDGTTGPAPHAGAVVPPNPFLLARTVPDGTARFPWNGFAGDGITMTNVADQDRVVFPGGSCSVGDTGVELSDPAVIPSPDGTKVAVLRRDISFYVALTTVAVVALVDGPTCPQVSAATYGGIVADPPPDTVYEGAVGQLVWSPDSSAVVFPVSHQPGNTRALDRLDASPSATVERILQPADTWVVPYGWSVADRLLFGEIDQTASGFVSRLVTTNLAGQARRTVDVATFRAAPLLPSAWAHLGYFVPGTTSIVYGDGSTTVTNGDGRRFPWFQLRIVADAPGAQSAPLAGAASPLQWHHEGQPPDDTDLPNVELVDRFTHG